MNVINNEKILYSALERKFKLLNIQPSYSNEYLTASLRVYFPQLKLNIYLNVILHVVNNKRNSSDFNHHQRSKLNSIYKCLFQNSRKCICSVIIYVQQLRTIQFSIGYDPTKDTWKGLKEIKNIFSKHYSYRSFVRFGIRKLI